MTGRREWIVPASTYRDAVNQQNRERTRQQQIRSLRMRRLERVPTDLRVCLVIVQQGFDYLDGLERRGIPMSYVQVAASLGLSLEAVRLIEARALVKVREAIGIEQPAPVLACERIALERLRRSA